MRTRSSAADRRRRGNVLILALAVGVVVALVLSGLLSMTIQHDGAALERSERAQARWGAEAGLAKAREAVYKRRIVGLTRLLEGPDRTPNTADDGIVPDHELPFGGGEVRVRISNDGASGESTFEDRNFRVIVRATGKVGSSEESLRAYVSVPDTFRSQYGVLAGHDLEISGTMDVTGTVSDVHANGNVTVAGAVEVWGDVTATGTVTVGAGNVHGTTTGGVPPVKIPILDVDLYREVADFVLGLDGRVTGATGAVVGSGVLGNSFHGWTYDLTALCWTFTGRRAMHGTYFAETDAYVSGSGADASPEGVWNLSLIARGNIVVSSSADIRTSSPGILLISNRDVRISGSPNLGTRQDDDDPPSTPGVVYAMEQFYIEGRTTKINGTVIGATSQALSPLVTKNHLAGTAQLGYEGDVIFSDGTAKNVDVLFWERTSEHLR